MVYIPDFLKQFFKTSETKEQFASLPTCSPSELPEKASPVDKRLITTLPPPPPMGGYSAGAKPSPAPKTEVCGVEVTYVKNFANIITADDKNTRNELVRKALANLKNAVEYMLELIYKINPEDSFDLVTMISGSPDIPVVSSQNLIQLFWKYCPIRCSLSDVSDGAEVLSSHLNEFSECFSSMAKCADAVSGFFMYADWMIIDKIRDRCLWKLLTKRCSIPTVKHLDLVRAEHWNQVIECASQYCCEPEPVSDEELKEWGFGEGAEPTKISQAKKAWDEARKCVLDCYRRARVPEEIKYCSQQCIVKLIYLLSYLGFNIEEYGVGILTTEWVARALTFEYLLYKLRAPVATINDVWKSLYQNLNTLSSTLKPSYFEPIKEEAVETATNFAKRLKIIINIPCYESTIIDISTGTANGVHATLVSPELEQISNFSDLVKNVGIDTAMKLVPFYGGYVVKFIADEHYLNYKVPLIVVSAYPYGQYTSIKLCYFKGLVSMAVRYSDESRTVVIVRYINSWRTYLEGIMKLSKYAENNEPPPPDYYECRTVAIVETGTGRLVKVFV